MRLYAVAFTHRHENDLEAVLLMKDYGVSPFAREGLLRFEVNERFPDVECRQRAIQRPADRAMKSTIFHIYYLHASSFTG